MNIIIITDKEDKIVSTNYIENHLEKLFLEKKLNTTLYEIDRNEVSPCIGCFGCWIKTPGECVIKDKGEEINKKMVKSDVVIYITHIVFGQYSYNMKNIIDRGLGKDDLPFFKKVNGRIVHPERYDKMASIYVIGCIDEEECEEVEIFINTHKKYRRNIRNIFICDREEKMSGIVKKILFEVSNL